MDGADVCRTSSRASRCPPNVICGAAILNLRWRRRKWRHPGPGAGFSTRIAEAEENGGPSASGRHLWWPHLREPEMRSSKMATGSGRAAVFLRLRNGGRKTRPILLGYCWNISENHIKHVIYSIIVAALSYSRTIYAHHFKLTKHAPTLVLRNTMHYWFIVFYWVSWLIVRMF